MAELWVSSNWATAWVRVNDKGVITDTAPVWRRFRGQNIENLLFWLRKKSKVEVVEIG